MTKYLPNKSSQRKLALQVFHRRKKHQGSSIYYIHIYRHTYISHWMSKEILTVNQRSVLNLQAQIYQKTDK